MGLGSARHASARSHDGPVRPLAGRHSGGETVPRRPRGRTRAPTAHHQTQLFQQRLIKRISDVIDDHRRAGHLHSPVPTEDLPYLLVRVMESHIYLALITGDEPDAARANTVLRALLPQQ